MLRHNNDIKKGEKGGLIKSNKKNSKQLFIVTQVPFTSTSFGLLK